MSGFIVLPLSFRGDRAGSAEWLSLNALMGNRGELNGRDFSIFSMRAKRHTAQFFAILVLMGTLGDDDGGGGDAGGDDNGGNAGTYT